jgi:hypothetical protein
MSDAPPDAAAIVSDPAPEPPAPVEQSGADAAPLVNPPVIAEPVAVTQVCGAFPCESVKSVLCYWSCLGGRLHDLTAGLNICIRQGLA